MKKNRTIVLFLVFLGFIPLIIQGQTNPFLAPPSSSRNQAAPETPSPQVQFPDTWEEQQVQEALSSEGFSLGRTLMRWQLILNREISQRVTDVREGNAPGLLLTLLAITFVYGIVHTLGPGHRKTVLVGWILNSRPGIGAITSTSILLGIFHTLGTGIIMLVAVFLRGVLGDSLMQTRDSVQQWANLFSGVVVFILGVFLLKNSFGHSHGHCTCGSHEKDYPGDHSEHHDHHDHHEHEEDCGLKKGKNLDDRRTLFLVALSMGLVPCPGSLSILAVSFLIGDLTIGLLAILSISLGTIITLLGLGIGVRYILYGAEFLSHSHGTISRIIEKTMEIIQVASACLVLLYGILWSIGGILTIF